LNNLFSPPEEKTLDQTLSQVAEVTKPTAAASKN